MSIRSAWIGELLVIISLFCGIPRAVATDEFRLKLDVDDKIFKSKDSPFDLRPMLRTEQRFRQQGMVLLKVFAGLRSDVASWLRLQAYYAHKDMFYADRKEIHLAVMDFVFHFKFGPVCVSDKNGNEWHSDGFYRYRNDLHLSISPGVTWLRLWLGDEIRVDSDQARLNMNDAKAGLDLRLGKTVIWSVYYDLESKHRSKPGWENTNVFQMMFILRLG